MRPVCAFVLLLQLNVVMSMVWSGGVTSSRAALVVDGVEAGDDIVVSKQKSLATPVRTIPVTSNETYMGVAYVEVSGLEPMTKYYYGSGQHLGSFTTFPVEGTATSFVAGVSSCAFTGYEHPVFTEIEDQDLAFFAHIGDFHYEDLESNDVGARLQAFRDVFKSKQQSSLWGSLAVAYMWDDHDFGANNALGTSVGKPAALKGYHHFAPHYPVAALPRVGETNPPLPTVDSLPVYQAFTYGRVRFLLTDLRSESRLKVEGPDAAAWEMSSMGLKQREWFFEELANYSSYKAMVWLNSKPWQGPDLQDPDSDKWNSFYQERAIISNKIVELGVDNLVMVSGDAHMLGMDDGSHTDFSDNGGAGIPLFHTSPMVQYGSSKDTGPFSVGCHAYKFFLNFQFGTMEVVDEAGKPFEIIWRGFRSGEEDPIMTLSLTQPFVKRGVRGEGGCSLPYGPPYFYVIFCVGFFVIVVYLGQCWMQSKIRYRFCSWGAKTSSASTLTTQPHAHHAHARMRAILESDPGGAGNSARSARMSLASSTGGGHLENSVGSPLSSSRSNGSTGSCIEVAPAGSVFYLAPSSGP